MASTVTYEWYSQTYGGGLSEAAFAASLPMAEARVRFERTQRVSDDDHRSANAGQGTVFVDAVNSIGAFDVPAGSRVAVSGHSMMVTESHACCDLFGRVHHWELKVR